MKLFNVTILSLCAVGALSACSSTKESFDFSKKAPDEFAVIKRAPLEIPTSNTLPPPRPGAPRPQEVATTAQAKTILFGTPSSKEVQTTTSGENILLQRTGASNVSSDIRDTVDQESVQTQKESISTFNKILGRAGKKIDTAADVIDPVKERERLSQEQANNS